MKAGVLAEPVLVGRERELSELQSCLDLAIEGKGNTVFVSGEAGSGKTRIAREFLSFARKKGVVVLEGWCLSDAAAPYFPFVEAFNTYFASSPEKEQLPKPVPHRAPRHLGGMAQITGEEEGITAWLTGTTWAERAGKPGEVSPQVWKDQVYAGVARTLHSLSTRETIVLFIDDIQWADSASLALLHYIARAVNKSERILVLATFRSEELTADAEGHPHPLAETLRMMDREDLSTEIKLSNLDRTNVSRIAEDMIGGTLQPTFDEKLASESHGNPLFVVESVRMLSERKGLIKENDGWRLAVDELDIPSKVKNIIQRRLGILQFDQRRVLEAASVIGERFEAQLLSDVLKQDSLEILQTLSVIAQSTSLVAAERDYYRFDHARSREVLYQELPAPLRRGYHARIAEKLETAKKGGRPPYSDLAFHYSQAEDVEKAGKYALAAGQDALVRFGNAEAVKHFKYVLQTHAENLDSDTEKTALEGLGDAYYANCMYEEAAKTFDDLANASTGTTRLRAYRKEMEAVWYKDQDPARALELVKRIDKFADFDPFENAQIQWFKGRALIWYGDIQGLTYHEIALKTFEEEYSLPDVAQLSWGTGVSRVMLGGDEIKGLGEILRGIALLHEIGDSHSEAIATNRGEASFIGLFGLWREAIVYWGNAIKIAERIGDLDTAAQSYQYISLFGWPFSGDLPNFEYNMRTHALPLCMKALEFSKKTDSLSTQCKIYATLTVIFACIDNVKDAEENYRKIMAMPPQTLSHPEIAGFVLATEAHLQAMKRHWKEAYRKSEEYLEHSKKIYGHCPGLKLFIKRERAWFLAKQERPKEARNELLEAEKLQSEIDEKFSHTNLQANLMARRNVVVGEEFGMRFDLTNISRKSGVVKGIEDVVPIEFDVIDMPSFCTLQGSTIGLKEKSVEPFGVETIKIKLKATQPGSYTLHPHISYVDDLGENKTCSPSPIVIDAKLAQPASETLPGRITTGYARLDRLLLGGIPEKYALILISPSSDERELLISRFLESGCKTDQQVLYVTCQAGKLGDLLKQSQTNLHILVCSTQADTLNQGSNNVFKLSGIDSLTGIGIALAKVFRKFDSTQTQSRRGCIDMISDVLLQHHAVTTRKWLRDLLSSLKLNGFTTLAVVDPQMHPPEELQAILGLFDGEIGISERQNATGMMEKVLKIRRLYNQKYLEDELALTKEMLEQ